MNDYYDISIISILLEIFFSEVDINSSIAALKRYSNSEKIDVYY